MTHTNQPDTRRTRSKPALRFLAAALLILTGACTTTPPPQPDPPDPAPDPSSNEPFTLQAKRQSLTDLVIADGFSPAELVTGGAQSTGWEDSMYVSRDEQTLSFMYLSVDLLTWDDQAGLDPTRFDEFRRGPDHGNDPPFAMLFLTTQIKPDGTTSEPVPFPFTRSGRTECCGMIDDDGNWYYSASPILPAYDLDIYRNDAKLPINTEFEEGNPHFDAATRTLYFDSQDRPDTPNPGRANIWMSERTDDGTWSEPVMLAAPVNLPDKNEVQPHVGPGGTLFFASNRETTGTAIFASDRLDQNQWSEPVKIVGPRTDPAVTSSPLTIAGVGEPSLTAAGTIYFGVLFFDPETQTFDADIARMRPQTPETP